MRSKLLHTSTFLFLCYLPFMAQSQNLQPKVDGGNAHASSEIAIGASRASNVPTATTLTDLVTKSSSNAIISGIASPTYGQELTAQEFTEIIPYKLAAAQRGYILRDIELDPRFQSNVAKISDQINLIALTAPSADRGLVLQGQLLGGRNSEVNKIGKKLETGSSTAGSVIRNPSAMLPGDLPRHSSIILGGTLGSIQGSTATVGPPQGNSLPPADASQENDNSRVYGGTPVPPGSDAFQDSVAVLGNNRICSGVLVSADTVITAAHCYCDGVTDEVAIGTSIITPVERIKIDVAKSEVFRTCAQVKSDISQGDIAVLKLAGKSRALPRLVGDLPQVKGAASVRAVGFGRTSSSIGFKYQVNIVIASHQCDGNAFSGIPDQQIYRCRPSHELVAAGLNRDTCGGDSGGPIYVFGDDTKPYVVGITSRAINPSALCGPGGIYVLFSASPVREWLADRGIIFN